MRIRMCLPSWSDMRILRTAVAVLVMAEAAMAVAATRAME